MQKGKVYLVGAGPGDPGLITKKGLDCIKRADVLVYDRLVSPRLLSYAHKNAEIIYVGKTPARHTLKQDEICNLLVEKANQGHTVARVKGGDPFVFGRGGEEAEVLVDNNISFEIVPGVTSAVAAPAYAGIPVTHRGYTSSFAVITGNEDPSKEVSSIRWEKIAASAGTLIFLMGMGNLGAITEQLVLNGRSPEEPVALVRWGTYMKQRVVTGTLGNIKSKAREQGFKNPAVIIVGDVVKLREKLNWFEKKPLFGFRVLVTRSREQASSFARLIEDYGGEPIEFPTIRISEPTDYEPVDRAIENLRSYSWIVFTSVNGVERFMGRLRTGGRDVRSLYGLKICAIGPKTAEALEKMGLNVDLVPDEYRAEALAESLKMHLKRGDSVLLPRADLARQKLVELLELAGAKVDEVITYKTVIDGGNAEAVRKMLADGQINLITFTSSSTVRNFVSLCEKTILAGKLENVMIATIGPITSKTARELGLKIDVEAKEYTIKGLMNAILERVGDGRN
ncbi:MAG TPA: uroporphyrinogen-III C-methyltransferase [Clostridia bacterium]|nr:uroporphyrinogen-III C-methyltransferase [Clostridia bacterium]